MLTPEMSGIIAGAGDDRAWLMEPEAKRLFALYGLPVPRFVWARKVQEGLQFAGGTGYPLMGKVVSPEVVHKSDAGGVVKVETAQALEEAFERFSHMKGFTGMLLEEFCEGTEIMLGSKNDEQFGPVILLGMGGTAVEIYRDVAIRMAPVKEAEIKAMIEELRAYRLLKGYRGSKPVDLAALVRLVLLFSNFVLDLKDVYESMDLNPVLCSHDGCVVADGRIMLAGFGKETE